MIKVGAITIGQSPRTDVTQDILPCWGTRWSFSRPAVWMVLPGKRSKPFSPAQTTMY